MGRVPFERADQPIRRIYPHLTPEALHRRLAALISEPLVAVHLTFKFREPFGDQVLVRHHLLMNRSRQYDFRAMRLTSGAQRGLASGGQSRPVLSAHYERGGQP